MKHLDTFSGLGCFSIAAQYVWEDDYKCHGFIEIDTFCQRWLSANFPGVPIYNDAETYRHDGTIIDLLTGGPPCQPVSIAGKRKGAEDDRWKWPAMLRIIQDVQPRWVIFENVYNLKNIDSGLLLDGILTNLENEGFEVLPPFILPACSQNALHRRDRIFVVGISNSKREPQQERSIENKPGRIINSGEDGNVADTINRRSQNRWPKSTDPISTKQFENLRSEIKKFYSIWDRFEWITGHDGKQRRIPEAESGIRLLVDGYPSRNDLLRAFGNAIVWQVVVPIMEAIKAIEDNTKQQTSTQT